MPKDQVWTRRRVLTLAACAALLAGGIAAVALASRRAGRVLADMDAEDQAQTGRSPWPG